MYPVSKKFATLLDYCTRKTVRRYPHGNRPVKAATGSGSRERQGEATRIQDEQIFAELSLATELPLFSSKYASAPLSFRDLARVYIFSDSSLQYRCF